MVTFNTMLSVQTEEKAIDTFLEAQCLSEGEKHHDQLNLGDLGVQLTSTVKGVHQ